MLNLSHIRAIIHYETLLQWRSRSWNFVAFGTVIIVILSLALSGIIQLDRPLFSRDSLIVTYTYRATVNEDGQIVRSDEPYLVLDPEIILNGRDIASITDTEIAQVNFTIIAFFTLWFCLLVLMFATLVFMTEIIPRDQQYQIRPMLDSTPLTLPTYLLGKVLSVWVNQLKIGLAAIVLCGLLSRVLFGDFDLSVFVLVSLVAFIPACLFAGALGVLVPAAAVTRRRAMLIGMIVLPLAGYAYFVTISDLWGLAMIARPILHFTPMPNRGLSDGNLLSLAILGYGKGLITLILTALFAWGLLKRQISQA